MKTDELLGSIRKLLTPFQFGMIIFESAGQKEISDFMNKAGVVYAGRRLQTIEAIELAQDLAEDSMNEIKLFRQTADWLTQRNQKFIEKIAEIPTKFLAGFPQMVSKIYPSGKSGAFLWALLVDPREEAKEVIPRYLKEIQKQADKHSKDHSKFEAFFERLQKGIFRSKDKTQVASMIYDLEKSLRESENKVKQLSKENKTLHERISNLTERDSHLAQLLSSADRDKKLVEREFKEKLQKIAQLEELLKRNENQNEIRARLHEEEVKTRDLEKEIKRQAHAIKEKELKLIEKEEMVCELESKHIEFLNEINKFREEKTVLLQKMNSMAAEIEVSRAVSNRSDHGSEKKLVLHGKNEIRTAVFLDGKTLFDATKKSETRLDYQKILETVTAGRKCVKTIAFIEAMDGENTARSEKFARFLARIGFETKFKFQKSTPSPFEARPVSLAFEVLEIIERLKLDLVILITNKLPDLPFFRLLKIKNVGIEYAGFAPPLPAQAEFFHFFYDLNRLEFHEVSVASNLTAKPVA